MKMGQGSLCPPPPQSSALGLWISKSIPASTQTKALAQAGPRRLQRRALIGHLLYAHWVQRADHFHLYSCSFSCLLIVQLLPCEHN